MELSDKDKLEVERFMDYPRLSKACNWLHKTFFQPIDDLFDRMFTWNLPDLERKAGLKPLPPDPPEQKQS